MSALEGALSASSEAGVDRWTAIVRAQLERLWVALQRHIANAEGEGGLFDELIRDAPRLAHRVDKLRGDHVVLVAELSALAAQLDEPVGEDRIAVTREAGTAFLAHLAHHRYLGSNLLHEAYDVDIDAAD